jgi:hypothetical protein
MDAVIVDLTGNEAANVLLSHGTASLGNGISIAHIFGEVNGNVTK